MNLNYPVYSGQDLGMHYSKENTFFRVWAPRAERVILRIYPDGDASFQLARFQMERSGGGTWICRIAGDLAGRYYTYQVITAGKRYPETADPYARAVGVNGKRSMILDLRSTDPEGFASDRGPAVIRKNSLIIAELSVADATGDEYCPARYPGLFLGLTEEGLRTPEGSLCGLDYLADLGVTHVQLMPIYDFATINEAKSDRSEYNWGYDPLNYNVPEGSYSTDSFHGEVRIRECKEMIAALHRKGIGVIMDVVYNHVYQVDRSPLQRTAPDYFFRHSEGKLSNGSGCGNEICSENPMVRKYIIDSLLYWVKEYHIDGFRFDLMGIYDIETMQEIRKALTKIRPDIILYGEGWAGGLCAYPEEQRAVKGNLSKLPGIGAFSDNIRDHVRGNVFDALGKGFVTGKEHEEMEIRFAVTAGMHHPQNAADTIGWHWAASPDQVINYLSCHDNLTLWDKLAVSCPELTEEELIDKNCLAAAILFTSQGIPFIMAGEDMARSKPLPDGKKDFCENSYNQPLSVNAIVYDRQQKYRILRDYYKGMIAFRKAHPSLQLDSEEKICSMLHFLEGAPEHVVGFLIDSRTLESAGSTQGEKLLIVYNAADQDLILTLAEGENWGVCVCGKHAGADVIAKVNQEVVIAAGTAFAAVLMEVGSVI